MFATCMYACPWRKCFTDYLWPCGCLLHMHSSMRAHSLAYTTLTLECGHLCSCRVLLSSLSSPIWLSPTMPSIITSCPVFQYVNLTYILSQFYLHSCCDFLHLHREIETKVFWNCACNILMIKYLIVLHKSQELQKVAVMVNLIGQNIEEHQI